MSPVSEGFVARRKEFLLKIVVNGEQKEIERGTTLGQLVLQLDLKSDRVAIELNRRIRRKGDWDSTELAEADTIEIVSFVGGGEG